MLKNYLVLTQFKDGKVCEKQIGIVESLGVDHLRATATNVLRDAANEEFGPGTWKFMVDGTIVGGHATCTLNEREGETISIESFFPSLQ